MADETFVMQFAIVIESGSHDFSAFAPDLPGCIATGKTLRQVRDNMRKAIEAHIASMIDDGDPLPAYDSFGETISIQIVALPAPRE